MQVSWYLPKKYQSKMQIFDQKNDLFFWRMDNISNSISKTKQNQPMKRKSK